MTRSKRSPVERAAFLVLSAALIAGAWICIDRAAYPVTEPYQFPITTDSPEWAALAEAGLARNACRMPAGLAEQMTAFAADVKAAGGRAIPLKVGGAFHSPFMAQAAQAFADELANAAMSKGRMPLYSNVTARPYDDNPRDLLSRQIASPVLWERIIRNMADAGMDTFIEIGPGKTLTNMVKKILPQAKTYCVAEMESLLKEVAGC